MTLYELIREEFENIIKTKNGWGKNEIMQMFDKAAAIAMAKYAREKGIDVT